MPMAPLLHGVLEGAINRLIALDPATPARLKPLAGKVCALEISDWRQEVFFLFHEAGIDVLGQFEGQADARISGTLAALAKLGAQAQKPGGALGSGVQFAGDIGVAQAFQQFFQSLDIDWEEQVALRTGDVLGHQLARGARALIGFAKSSAEAARLNLKEYLQEEARLLPVRDEIEAYADAVDELQSDLARLEARLRRLQDRA
ncbi:MAG: SCP2 sterol-binding domain-containing protein [Gammaproteobacteria bacterium]|nr:SCP2 sterol-binding domain-containing protein [Gammaproteobacteria bacterium]